MAKTEPFEDGQLNMFQTEDSPAADGKKAPRKGKKKAQPEEAAIILQQPADLSTPDVTLLLKSIVEMADISSKEDNVFPVTPTRNLITVDNIEQVLNEALTPDVIDELNGEDPKRPDLPSVSTISDDLIGPVSKRLTAYDRAVLEAVYSEIKASDDKVNAVFPVRSVYRTMCGNKELRCSDDQKKQVMASALKLMSTIISVELVGKDNKTGTEVSYKKWLPILPATIEEINIAGNKATSIRITNNPEFLNYAYAQRGIVPTPKGLLSLGDISNTQRNIAIISYLHHKLANVLYSDKADENRARLENPDCLYLEYAPIYEIGEIRPLAHAEGKGGTKKYSATYCNRIRDVVRKILTNWTRDQFILGWEEKSGGRGAAIDGCFIFLPKKEDIVMPN